MIAIVDYGVGNLFSLSCSLASIGADVCVTGDAKALADADGIILPGVGAFCDAADKLRKSGLDEVIKEEAGKGKKLLGICLGMQMLFDSSEESFGGSPVQGLSVLPGKVVRFPSDMGLKVPQIGWNALSSKNPILPDGEYVYFVHSYYCVPAREEDIAATVDYGIEYCCSVRRDNVLACQFHPEKSGEAGLAILQRWARMTRK